MWIKFDDVLLNTDTGAKFEIEVRNNYGDEKEPELLHLTPAGVVSFDGLPMGGWCKTLIQHGEIDELRKTLDKLTDWLIDDNEKLLVALNVSQRS